VSSAIHMPVWLFVLIGVVVFAVGAAFGDRLNR
jgi:hypothetical protein